MREEKALWACLLAKARRGNRAAFDTLARRLEPRVHSFARRLVGTRDREPGADDLGREAFHALFLHLNRLETPDNLLPFLFRVVRNRAYDILRRQGRFRMVPLDEPATESGWIPAERLISDAPGPERILERMLLLTELQAAIDRLPENLRQPLLLYSEEEFTYAQIADTLQISEAMIKSRLFQARQRLRRLLRPDTLRALGVAGDDISST